MFARDVVFIMFTFADDAVFVILSTIHHSLTYLRNVKMQWFCGTICVLKQQISKMSHMTYLRLFRSKIRDFMHWEVITFLTPLWSLLQIFKVQLNPGFHWIKYHIEQKKNNQYFLYIIVNKVRHECVHM